VKPADKPLDGALPAHLPARDVKAQVMKLTGGRLLPTPAATRTITSTGDAITLSGIAAQQGLSAACEDPRLAYDFGWAQRLPAHLPLYPGAALKEAAGTDDPRCAIRAATFATSASSGQVLDFLLHPCAPGGLHGGTHRTEWRRYARRQGQGQSRLLPDAPPIDRKRRDGGDLVVNQAR
jgi:hypothetical protein